MVLQTTLTSTHHSRTHAQHPLGANRLLPRDMGSCMGQRCSRHTRVPCTGVAQFVRRAPCGACVSDRTLVRPREKQPPALRGARLYLVRSQRARFIARHAATIVHCSLAVNACPVQLESPPSRRARHSPPRRRAALGGWARRPPVSREHPIGPCATAHCCMSATAPHGCGAA